MLDGLCGIKRSGDGKSRKNDSCGNGDGKSRRRKNKIAGSMRAVKDFCKKIRQRKHHYNVYGKRNPLKNDIFRNIFFAAGRKVYQSFVYHRIIPLRKLS